MNKNNQKNVEETSITRTRVYLDPDRYVIKEECRGGVVSNRVVSIRLIRPTVNNVGKFKNCEVRFADGKVFTGMVREGRNYNSELGNILSCFG